MRGGLVKYLWLCLAVLALVAGRESYAASDAAAAVLEKDADKDTVYVFYRQKVGERILPRSQQYCDVYCGNPASLKHVLTSLQDIVWEGEEIPVTVVRQTKTTIVRSRSVRKVAISRVYFSRGADRLFRQLRSQGYRVVVCDRAKEELKPKE